MVQLGFIRLGRNKDCIVKPHCHNICTTVKGGGAYKISLNISARCKSAYFFNSHYCKQTSLNYHHEELQEHELHYLTFVINFHPTLVMT